MMHEINSFHFEGSKIREITDSKGNPWFVGRDIAYILGYKNTKDALSIHCKGVVKYYPLETTGGMQKVRLISEADLYRLIINSKLPTAQGFERWIMGEVLPAIRKKGGYLSPVADFTNPEIIQRILDGWKADRAQLGKITKSEGDILPREAGKIINGKPNTFLSKLVDDRILYRERGKLIPYQPYIDRGYFKVRESYSEMRNHTYIQTYVTPRGIRWLSSKYMPTNDLKQERIADTKR